MKVAKASAATLPHPAPPCPPLPHRSSPPPPLIRCLIAALSGPSPFLQKQAPTHPCKEQTLRMGWVRRHSLPGARPLLVGGHRGPGHYSAGRRALRIPPSNLGTNWSGHPPSCPTPTSPPQSTVGAWQQSPSVGCPRLGGGLPGLVGGRISCNMSPGPEGDCFSQHPRDRPWKPFLEALRAPEVSQALLELEGGTPSRPQSWTLAAR